MKTSVSKVNLWQQIPYATYLRGLAALLGRARISYRIKIGSISLFMKSTLSFTLGTNSEEIATTIFSLGLTYIAFPPSPKAAYECSASSITHHKYPYFRRRAFQTLCTCVLSVIHFLGIICLPFQYPSLKYNCPNLAISIVVRDNPQPAVFVPFGSATQPFAPFDL